jgi:hypothetical protein
MVLCKYDVTALYTSQTAINCLVKILGRLRKMQPSLKSDSLTAMH